MARFRFYCVAPRSALAAFGMLLIAGGGAAAQDRVFTGRVDVSGLPVNVHTVVVKCDVRPSRAPSEGQTSIATALADDGTRRVSAPFTVRVRGNPTATTYHCQLGFRSSEGLQWAHPPFSPRCRVPWTCGALGSEVAKSGSLP